MVVGSASALIDTRPVVVATVNSPAVAEKTNPLVPATNVIPPAALDASRLIAFPSSNPPLKVIPPTVATNSIAAGLVP